MRVLFAVLQAQEGPEQAQGNARTSPRPVRLLRALGMALTGVAVEASLASGASHVGAGPSASSSVNQLLNHQ